MSDLGDPRQKQLHFEDLGTLQAPTHLEPPQPATEPPEAPLTPNLDDPESSRPPRPSLLPKSHRATPHLTFAEALGQLQAAHMRDVDVLHRELRRTNRKIQRLESASGSASDSWLASPDGTPNAAAVNEGFQGFAAVVPTPEWTPVEAYAPGSVPLPGAQDGHPEGSGQCKSRSTLASPAEHPDVALVSGSLGGKRRSYRSSEWTNATNASAESQLIQDAREFAIRWNPFSGRSQNRMTVFAKYGEGWEEARKERIAYKIVKSWPFSVMSYTAIILNSMFIGVCMQLQMDAMVTGTGSHKERWAAILELAFVAYFTFELFCKVLAEDYNVFLGSDWQWNVLDTFLVIAALLQLIIDMLSTSGNVPSLSLTRTIRLFRITRVLRMVRIVRAVQSLRVMIFAIFRSLDVLFWVLAVLLFFKYIFAMIFMHGTISYFESYPNGGGSALTLVEMQMFDTPQQHHDYMKASWGSVQQATVTLFESITGGRNWDKVYCSLDKIGAVYGVMFLAYIYFTVFLVLNVVIGTVVDVTSGVASRDSDLRVEQEMKAVREYATDIKEFFQQADTDQSGQLSWDEFRTHLEDDHVKAYFQTLDLDIRKAHVLFDLLDTDKNGEVGIDEFLDGCLRLKGQAKALDLNLVIYQLENLIKGSSLLTCGDASPRRAGKSIAVNR